LKLKQRRGRKGEDIRTDHVETDGQLSEADQDHLVRASRFGNWPWGRTMDGVKEACFKMVVKKIND
jgi:hypothetical protein